MSSQSRIPHQALTLPLTPRERDVLTELARGNSNKCIARNLSISPNTVDGYVKDIYRKLGVRSRSMAAVIAVQHGMLDRQPLTAS